MKQKNVPFYERDLSWLSFNHRYCRKQKISASHYWTVVEVPWRFIPPTWKSFFKVRVAQIRNLIRAGKRTKKALNFKPEDLLKSILKIVNSHQFELSSIFNKQLIPELRTPGNPDYQSGCSQPMLRLFC
jgi:polyphosphate kinase